VAGNLVVPPHHDPACWGCGSAPAGIQLAQPASEGLTEYEASFSFDERHQAGPGLVHGGLVAAALDEACGLLATWYRFPAVTARIFVRYRQPVPINTELLVRARLVGERGRRLHVDGELTDGNSVLAEARAAFLHVPLEHFLATPEGRAAADAWRTLKSVPPAADKR
jgi:acyl-coenzyme A thioesterase PaaI-like protein